MIQRPPTFGAFQYVILVALRSAQLMRGCRPRVESLHKPTVTAQLEVSQGFITQLPVGPDAMTPDPSQA